jgi:hypothetical protein
MTCTVLFSILFGKQYRGSVTLISQFSMCKRGITQQMQLQSLFIKCEIKLITEMTAPLIREMNKKKVIIRNIKVRIKYTKRKDNKMLNGMEQSVIPALKAWYNVAVQYMGSLAITVYTIYKIQNNEYCNARILCNITLLKMLGMDGS